MNIKRFVAVGLIAIVITFSACGNKSVNNDPWATFNSISARSDRIARLYSPAALDALPLLAVEMKWDAEKTNKVKALIVQIRDTSASVATTLGRIKDSALTADQRVLIGPLLTAIGEGLDELDRLNLFGSLEGSSKIEITLRVTALALRETGRLLTLPPEPKPQARLERPIFEGGSFSYA